MPSLRRLRKLLFVLFLTYVFVIVMLVFLENRMVYPLESAADHWENPPDPAIEEVTFPSADGVTIHGWYLAQPGAAEVLVICHGNGGNLSYRGHTLLRFREVLGCSVLIFDYPGYGKSSGKPSEEGCYASAEAALRWLNEFKSYPSRQVILFGESLGGGIATEIAKRQPCRALVLFKTFTTLPAVGQRRYRWLPVRWLMRNKFDSLAKIRDIHVPTFIASATLDEIVPFEMGKELHAAALGPKEFMALEGEHHNDRLSDDFMMRLKRFLEQIR